MGVDPFEILLTWAKDPDPSISIPAAKECAKYIYPQLKSLEVKTPDSGLKIVVEDYVSKT